MAECPIWGTPCESVKEDDPRLDRWKVKGSPRAGGDYRIKDVRCIYKLEDETKARLTTWLIDQRNQGIHSPRIGMDELDHAANSKPLPVHERADRLLRFLADRSAYIGETLTLSSKEQIEGHDLYLSALAWSESTVRRELWTLVGYLREQEWVRKIDSIPSADGYRCHVTVDGYARIGDQVTTIDPVQCFVAMWFDSSVDEVYQKAIAPAIRNAGYKPVRIDQREDLIDKIDDAIVAEIRRSLFLVADFTHGKKGARGGVYYEAGFAHGLEKPVIFMCRKDKFDEIHFDTRQYNTIEWTDNDFPRLKKRLTDRIVATIGEGPRRGE